MKDIIHKLNKTNQTNQANQIIKNKTNTTNIANITNNPLYSYLLNILINPYDYAAKDNISLTCRAAANKIINLLNSKYDVVAIQFTQFNKLLSINDTQSLNVANFLKFKDKLLKYLDESSTSSASSTSSTSSAPIEYAIMPSNEVGYFYKDLGKYTKDFNAFKNDSSVLFKGSVLQLLPYSNIKTFTPAAIKTLTETPYSKKYMFNEGGISRFLDTAAKDKDTEDFVERMIENSFEKVIDLTDIIKIGVTDERWLFNMTNTANTANINNNSITQ